ncbi:hypothetical protein MGU_00905 [Metarhizium guizhouense ARSEF 977]|uniref:Uncharacterized protein n=2 Tax=Metarhizium TaxID=5529 RepID=A0A0B4IC17_METGA
MKSSHEENGETRGFLEENDGYSQSIPKTNAPRRAFWHLIFSYMLNIVLAAILLWFLTKPWDPSQGIYSPANAVIEYETKVFAPGVGPSHSPYQGYPDDDMDDAWDDLYQCKYKPQHGKI